MLIRNGDIGDLEAIRDIFNDAILHTTAVYEYQVFTQEKVKHWINEKLNNGWPLMVLEEEGKCIGFASYGSFRSRAAYKYTVEHSVYVNQAYRGKGYGRLLLERIIQEARNRNIHAMIGGIDSSNELSILLHEKLGFRQVGRISEVAFKFGRWLDLVFMELVLETPTSPQES